LRGGTDPGCKLAISVPPVNPASGRPFSGLGRREIFKKPFPIIAVKPTIVSGVQRPKFLPSLFGMLGYEREPSRAALNQRLPILDKIFLLPAIR
jgi:hypothetical protein